MTEKFLVTGMTCSACSAGIEKTLNKLSGVEKAEVSLMNESMTVTYSLETISREDIIHTVKELGYGIERYDDNVLKQRKAQPQTLKKRFFVSLAFLIPLMYFSMGGMVGLPQPSLKIAITLQMILSAIIIAINYKFFTNGIKALVKKIPNMDTLVSIGSGISFIYSFVFTVMIYANRLQHAHLFYESAAMILTLVTLGKWLEEKSKRKTGDEIEKLIKLMPNGVTVEKDGREVKKIFSEIEIGDVIIVKQGEYVPVDGKIIDGHAYVDRSAITGESMPIEMQIGDNVTGADIVKSGYMKVLTEKVGADTTLSQIIKMVKDAGASKAPIQKMADKISNVFVPIVCVLSLLTFIIWYCVTQQLSLAANYAISVLVISCPCSLGLATPVAVMAAMGRGMALGILYKDAEALQKAKNINCVLLDKTATLTVGLPKVTDFTLLKGETENILALSRGIESRSNHPIAECIKAFVDEKNVVGLEVESYEYFVGKGAKVLYQNAVYYLGNSRLVAEIDDRAKEIEEIYSKQGKTVVFLANEKEILAYFLIADTLKEESKNVIRTLKEKGLKVAMLTGDNENVAKSISQEVGIDEYVAECLPQDKVEAVKRIRKAGGIVAMIGDGINDSPALKEADIGVAMGNGTDVAIDSADVVLSNGNLELVGTMVELSFVTVKNIKQNLFWAFFYNTVAIPVAAGVFAFANISLNPMLGAAAMSMSSLFVVTNALKLMRFGKNKKESKKVDMEKTLKIEGMMCQHCVAHVTKALQSVSGVESVDVNLKKKTAVVVLNSEVTNEALTTAIVDAGYEVKKIL